MRKLNCGLPAALVVCFMFGLVRTDAPCAGDREMKPDRVIAAHLESIGPAEILAGLKNRGIRGTSTVHFILGGTGNMKGRAAIVSAGRNLAIRLMYGGAEYPEEYFTFNGAEVQVRTIAPGQRSPLGDFLFRYNQVIQEGILGGVYSLAWPLLSGGRAKDLFKYDRAKIDGNELHVLEYRARPALNDIKVKLYFDGSFRHVRTEYRLRVRGEQPLQAGSTVTRGATAAVTRDAGIQDPVMDSHYVLIEKFEDFKKVDGMTLPHAYTLEYSIEGQGSTFLAHWTVQAEQWVHNGRIDAAFMQ